MIFLWKRRWGKPDISSAARQMAREGVERHRAKVRATCDRMRADLGMEPARWPS